jgi:DNA polymerase/3'-5' exonuclease PolX
MTTRVKHTITEVDVVACTDAIDKTDYSEAAGKWPAGTTGAVVSDYGDHKEVEISDDSGVPLDFPVVPVKKLELVTKYNGGIAVNPPIRPRSQKRRKPRRGTASPGSVA